MIEIAPASADRRLGVIKDAVRRLSRLITALLAAERASLDSPRMEQLDAAEIAVNAAGAIDDSGGEVRVIFDHAGQSLRFVGDRDMLVTALCNLIGHA